MLVLIKKQLLEEDELRKATLNGHFIVLHRCQHLLQLLLTGHVLYLAQVELLKFHWDISSLERNQKKPTLTPGANWKTPKT